MRLFQIFLRRSKFRDRLHQCASLRVSKGGTCKSCVSPLLTRGLAHLYVARCQICCSSELLDSPLAAGLPFTGLLAAGLSVFGGGVAIGFGVALISGPVGTAVFAGAVFGVASGLAAVFVFAGTGTNITPPSCGINWLPPFGSI